MDGEISMKVVFTLSVVLRLAFWLLVLGIALGLTLGFPGIGASVDVSGPGWPVPFPDQHR
jgi:hypothetical protein